MFHLDNFVLAMAFKSALAKTCICYITLAHMLRLNTEHSVRLAIESKTNIYGPEVIKDYLGLEQSCLIK